MSMLYKELPVKQVDCDLWAIVEHYKTGELKLHKYVVESMARDHAKVNRVKWFVLNWVFKNSGGQWGATVHEWSWVDIARATASEVRFRWWSCRDNPS